MVSVNGPASYEAPAPSFAPGPHYAPPPVNTAPPQDIFGMIEKLADLRSKGVLDEAEFQAKKAELLSRL